jgi:hypothetical protein
MIKQIIIETIQVLILTAPLFLFYVKMSKWFGSNCRNSAETAQDCAGSTKNSEGIDGQGSK